MKKFFISALFLSLISLSGCAIDSTNAKNEGEEGDLSLNLAPSGDVTYKNGQQGSDLFAIPDIADFKVLVFNSKNEQYASFAKFSDMPSPTRLKAGSYTIVASHGANPPAAFDAPYFEGRAPFTIDGMGNTPLQLSCKIANVLVGVQYTDKFKAVFDNYSLDVMTEYTVNEEGGYEALRFTGDDKRVGFVRVAPKVYLSVSLHKIDTDKTYRYGVTPLEGVKGGEYYKLVFDADARGNAVVNITLNDETQSKPMDVTLGEEYLPKLPPAISTTFNTEVPYSFRYGFLDASKPLIAALKAQGTIEKAVMNINSDYAAQKGVPSTIDFANITPDVANALKSLGIEWSKSLVGSTSGRILFTKMLTSLDASMAQAKSEHIFTIKITDSFGRETEKEIDFEVLPIGLKLNLISNANAWSKHILIEPAEILFVTPEEAQGMHVNYQYSVDNVNWKDIASTLENGKAVIKGFKPNTTYSIRANISKLQTEAYSFTTEEATPIPNASFEEYYTEKFGMDAMKQSVCLWPYTKDATDKFWETLNPMTTRDRSDCYYRSIPCVNVTDDASDGDNALTITTVGWGNGSKKPSSSRLQPSSRIPGKLFIGDYTDSDDWTSGIKSMVKGKPFASRPLSISFDYKYEPLNNNKMVVQVIVENRDGGNVTEIARGEFVDGVKVSAYTKKTISLTYSSTTLKATHLYMVFQSCEDGSLTNSDLKFLDTGEHNTFLNLGDKDQMTIGSRLWVDHVVVGY